MKNQVAAAALVAAAGAYARKGEGYGGQKVSTTTITYDDCPSMPPETIITVTQGQTVTYCPDCPMMSNPGYTTVYTTTYQSLCPTGLVPATYTVTESCPEPTPTWTPGPSHIPQGYTVTQKACTVCGQATPTVTITEPCGCEAHEGTPGPPPPQYPAPTPPSGSGPPVAPPAGKPAPPAGKPAPLAGKPAPPAGKPAPPAGKPAPPAGKPEPPSGGSSPPAPSEECSEYEDGQPQCSSKPSPPPQECSEGPDGQPQCSSASVAPAQTSKPGSGAPPYPTPTREPCSGAECRVPAATGSLPSNIRPLTPGESPASRAGGTSPQKGAASRISSLVACSSSALAIIIAALAFAL